jgi:hypothetical protein
LALVGLAHGATLRSFEEAKELAEKILGRAMVGDIDGIGTIVKPHWAFPEEELEALVAQTAQQRAQLTPRLGKSVGYTLVRREVIAETLLRLTYLERFENTGLRWQFTFYKARDTWKFQRFTWDEDLTKVFGSSH